MHLYFSMLLGLWAIVLAVAWVRYQNRKDVFELEYLVRLSPTLIFGGLLSLILGVFFVGLWLQ